MTNAFLGDWHFTRTIVDRQNATTLAGSGSASLRAHDAERQYTETLSYVLGGKPLTATRAYRYRDGIAGEIVASFVDGSPFFTALVGSDGYGHARHICGGDRYDVTFRLGREQWMTEWNVTGTKGLLIVTRFRRA